MSTTFIFVTVKSQFKEKQHQGDLGSCEESTEFQEAVVRGWKQSGESEGTERVSNPLLLQQIQRWLMRVGFPFCPAGGEIIVIEWDRSKGTSGDQMQAAVHGHPMQTVASRNCSLFPHSKPSLLHVILTKYIVVSLFHEREVVSGHLMANVLPVPDGYEQL